MTRPRARCYVLQVFRGALMTWGQDVGLLML